MVLYPRRSCPVPNLPPASETGDTRRGLPSPWSSADLLSAPATSFSFVSSSWLFRGCWICQSLSPSPRITEGLWALASLSSPQLPHDWPLYRSFNPHPSGPLEFGSLIVAPLENLKSGFCLFIVSNHMPLLPSCGKEGKWWTCLLLPLILLTIPAKHTHSCSHSHSYTHTHAHTHIPAHLVWDCISIF